MGGGAEGASRENLSVLGVPERKLVSLCESFTESPSHVKAGPWGILTDYEPGSDCKQAY